MNWFKLYVVAAIILLSGLSAFSQNRLEEARHWCDTASLSAMEGIWLLPHDNIYLLARRSSAAVNSEYSLSVVAALDGITEPGTNFGCLRHTPDPKKFVISLPTKMSASGPQKFHDCDLLLADDGSSLIIAPPKKKYKFTLSPLSLLPGFWHIARFSYSPQSETQTQGLIKVYPDYDGNGSERHNPRFL